MKQTLVAGVIAAMFFVGGVEKVLAAPHVRIPPVGQQLNAGSCNPAGGALVVNVTQQVVNDIDAGVANYWAFDSYTLQTQVWQMSTGTFCAVVRYLGSFTSLAGPSPAGNINIPAGITGTFDGGFVSLPFTGKLKSVPLAPTKGPIGSINFMCDASGYCPGYVDWTTLYFDAPVNLQLGWWGWTYHGGNNGTWVETIDGISGDIHLAAH